MSRHLLGVLEPSIVFQVKRDAGCPPGVTSEDAPCYGPTSRIYPHAISQNGQNRKFSDGRESAYWVLSQLALC